jgi:pyruvate dehydrogenase E2 component (dihydrolipoamide acetyltransferase)
MAIEITIPRLGWSMEEGTFVEWLKHPGDTVRSGEPLFALESEKVTMDVEALDSGVLYLPPDAPTAGAVVKPGQLIGYLLAEGENTPIAAVPATPAPRVAVTPRARRIARELGVDLSAVKGSGHGGRVREQDVRAAVPATPAAAVTSVRRTIAERMVESNRQTVPVTLMRRADVSRLTALRNRWKLRLQPAPAPAIHDIIAKLVAIALQQHPYLARQGADGVHIGVAVDTERGLIVPVIRNVQGLTLPEVASRSRELIDSTRRRDIKADDLKGGVFSISNLGSFGVEAFTPVINYPEIAILGLGAIRWEPVVLSSGQIVAREQMALSLTFDHRVVDGAPAARFLASITALVEEPPAEVHCP